MRTFILMRFANKRILPLSFYFIVGHLYRIYLSSLVSHNYPFPCFFLPQQRRSPTLRVIRNEIFLHRVFLLLPHLFVFLLPVLTTRLFSRYTTFFQGYESKSFPGVLIFPSFDVLIAEETFFFFSTKLLTIVNQNCVASKIARRWIGE